MWPRSNLHSRPEISGDPYYTHRVAISNSRLISITNASVTFKWKDYRASESNRAKVMTLAIDEFIRRFLIHILPGGFHRTVCSPTAGAPRTSRKRVSCSTCGRRRMSPVMATAPVAVSSRDSRSPVPAAAAA
jgi:hypothetical protein